MTPLLWVGVAVAGGAGAVLRLLVDEAVRARSAVRDLPVGLLVVNVTGALALGLLAGAGPDHDVSLLLGTALVGAYTTFSTWMLDTVQAARAGALRIAVANVAVSLALGLAAATAGRAVGAAL